MMQPTKISARWSFRKQILTLFYAFRDDRTPWYARLTSLLSVIYLLSPADFVPDVIPFAGFVDDLFIVPFLVDISTRLLPADVKRAAEQRARQRSRKITWILVLIGVALAVGMFFLVRSLR